MTKAVEADMPYDIDERHMINMRREFRYVQNFHAYKNLIEDLSTRRLTYEGDALKSMAGVRLSDVPIYASSCVFANMQTKAVLFTKHAITRILPQQRKR